MSKLRYDMDMPLKALSLLFNYPAPFTILEQDRVLDFMSDSLTSGKRFRTLNVLDDFNREGIGIFAALRLPATMVIQ